MKYIVIVVDVVPFPLSHEGCDEKEKDMSCCKRGMPFTGSTFNYGLSFLVTTVAEKR
jgi:hypothetical protein